VDVMDLIDRIDRFTSNFESAYYKKPVKISLDNMNYALQVKGTADL